MCNGEAMDEVEDVDPFSAALLRDIDKDDDSHISQRKKPKEIDPRVLLNQQLKELTETLGQIGLEVPPTCRIELYVCNGSVAGVNLNEHIAQQLRQKGN